MNGFVAEGAFVFNIIDRHIDLMTMRARTAWHLRWLKMMSQNSTTLCRAAAEAIRVCGFTVSILLPQLFVTDRSKYSRMAGVKNPVFLHSMSLINEHDHDYDNDYNYDNDHDYEYYYNYDYDIEYHYDYDYEYDYD